MVDHAVHRAQDDGQCLIDEDEDHRDLGQVPRVGQLSAPGGQVGGMGRAAWPLHPTARNKHSTQRATPEPRLLPPADGAGDTSPSAAGDRELALHAALLGPSLRATQVSGSSRAALTAESHTQPGLPRSAQVGCERRGLQGAPEST